MPRRWTPRRGRRTGEAGAAATASPCREPFFAATPCFSLLCVWMLFLPSACKPWNPLALLQFAEWPSAEATTAQQRQRHRLWISHHAVLLRAAVALIELSLKWQHAKAADDESPFNMHGNGLHAGSRGALDLGGPYYVPQPHTAGGP